MTAKRWPQGSSRRYTADMTTTPIAAPAAEQPSAGLSSVPVTGALTAADLDRIAAAVDAARTESTRRVYAYTWGQWARWCAARPLCPLPGDPAALCAYLTERAAEGIAVSSLDGACTAIRYVHRTHGAADPVSSETVRQVRLGLRRTYGTAPRRLARPLSTADIGLILDAIDRSTPGGIRDAAIILLGFASAMRGSELVALTLLDLQEEAGSILVTIRRSKTDQEGHGEIVAVARGAHQHTCPVLALGAGCVGMHPARCSPAAGRAGSGSSRCRGTRWPGCSAPAPATPVSMPPGSLPTRCAPGMPPPPPSAGYRSPGSRHRPGTRTFPSWSTAISGPSKPSPTPPAATSAYEARLAGALVTTPINRVAA